MAAETKYSVLPLDLKSDQGEEKQTVVHPDLGKLSKLEAYRSFHHSVRKECFNGELPPAPLKCLVEATVLLADISGFTKLGEKLNEEHGDASVEIFASQVSAAISALVSVVQQYGGETVKFAGDCLICLFTSSSEKKNNGDGEEDSDGRR